MTAKTKSAGNTGTQLAEAGNNLPTTGIAMFAQDAGLGMEDFNNFQEDFAVPFLKVAGDMTPETKSHETCHIEGLVPGNVFNSVTREIIFSQDPKTKEINKDLLVIPLAYKHVYIEWKPDNAGLVARHDAAEGKKLDETTVRNPIGKAVLPNGNILENTHEHYVYVLDGNGGYPALVSFTSTRLKISRKWNTTLTNLRVSLEDGNSVTPPMFGTVWRLGTIVEQGQKGSWWTWHPTFHDVVKDEGLYKNLRDLSMQFRTSEVKTRYDEEASSTSTDNGDTF